MAYISLNVQLVIASTRIPLIFGMTTTTLSRMLTMHLASGAPKNHMGTNHNSTLTRQNLVNNTSIINTQFDYNRLQIMKDIIINETNPCINKQYTGTQRVLKLL